MMTISNQFIVAVIGAGPAGLFASRELANQGVQVLLLNRDIKPGGLAEYGIYPDKYRMKEGLRAQFRQILSNENIHYFGNLSVEKNGNLTLDELNQFGVQAVLVTVGAQGTKWLGLPGEGLAGVFHAKDLVYHYNRLPPFSHKDFKIGRKVAIVGVGNVMLDIARYMIEEKKVDEVIAVARRGPAEVKFDKKELEYIACNLDLAAVDAEIERVSAIMRAVGQDPVEARDFIHSAQAKASEISSATRFSLRFLSSPVRILDDGCGNAAGLEIEDTTLVMENGQTKAQGLGIHHILDVDTIVFAIGDRVDDLFGLPVQGNGFVKASQPRYPVDGLSYEIEGMQNVFVAGWSRQASTGLVGIARKDGINGANAVLQYLKSISPCCEGGLERVLKRLSAMPEPIITQAHLAFLEKIEKDKAVELGLPDFKFRKNIEMLTEIGLAEIDKFD
jgi:ferredoxin--NADP+ reductase